MQRPTQDSQTRECSLWVCALALAIALCAGSCNDYPVHSLLDHFEARVTDQLTNDEPVKLDFLWVIDHSPSMCQEQRELAKGFGTLTQVLNTFGEGTIDAQMAVVTVQQAADKTDIRVVGRFQHDPATAFPPNCYERVRTNCLDNDQCSQPKTLNFTPMPSDSSLCKTKAPGNSKAGSGGKWKCKGPKNQKWEIKPDKMSNLNCSLNTYCEAQCTKGSAGDEACAKLFEPQTSAKERKVKCVVPGGGQGVGGCIFQPETSTCKKYADLSPVLGKGELDQFPCIATVGAAQTQESKFEGGFRSAWTALDPDGPNCDHASCLLSLRSCCITGASWCKETDPPLVAKNKKKCVTDRVELCEYLSPFGHCKRQLSADQCSGGSCKPGPCCQGPHDLKCSSHRNKKQCDALVKSKCSGLVGKTDRVPSMCQNTRLLRDDAYLVLVFVSDDDDCSMHLDLHPHDKKVMTKEIWERCQIKGDSMLSNRALAEGHCEFKRKKSEATKIKKDPITEEETKIRGEAMYCPSDCMVGSTSKEPPCASTPNSCTGAPKCPDGCKEDSKARAECLAKATEADGCPKCPDGCKEGSKARAECLAKAKAQMEAFDLQHTKNFKYKSNQEHLAGWQFAPVSEFVNRFKSLKEDPARVIVAAIVGDTLHGENTDPKSVEASDYTAAENQQRWRDRVNFYHSNKKDIGPGQAPYICLGNRGEASYGTRYIELASAFRDNGVVRNICKGSDFGPALAAIAETILKNVVKICLPQPPETNSDGALLLKVTHSRGGKTTELERTNGPGDGKTLSYYIKASSDCRHDQGAVIGESSACVTTRDCNEGLTCLESRCQVYSDAIYFSQVLTKEDRIEVNYKADLGL